MTISSPLIPIFAILYCWIPPTDALICYGCASSLPDDTDDSAKFAAKAVIGRKFNLPSVHVLCDRPKDSQFSTVDVLHCQNDDICAKIEVEHDGKSIEVHICQKNIISGPVCTQLAHARPVYVNVHAPSKE